MKIMRSLVKIKFICQISRKEQGSLIIKGITAEIRHLYFVYDSERQTRATMDLTAVTARLLPSQQ